MKKRETEINVREELPIALDSQEWQKTLPKSAEFYYIKDFKAQAFSFEAEN